MIPISSVRFGKEEEDLVLEVLRSGSIAQGPMVHRFEQKFGELFGVEHAIAVNNGTTALVAALEVLDLEPGDEVVTTPFTFVATVNAILASGATAVLADIREDDFNLDPVAASAAVTSRTRALMPVHLYGQMADMDPIMELASEHDLSVVEDSAQSHGATYRGVFAGGFGLGTFSFYATKNITTGEGGLITTNDGALADRLRVLRNQGMRERYVYEVAGNNYRLTDLQAAIGIPQLDRYDELVAARRHNAATLSDGLSGLHGIEIPLELPGRTHVWHQYTIRVTDDCSISRDELVTRLGEKGIGAGIYYPRLLSDYGAYSENARVRVEDVPVARRIAGEVLSLPVHPHLSESNLAQIIESVRDLVGTP